MDIYLLLILRFSSWAGFDTHLDNVFVLGSSYLSSNPSRCCWHLGLCMVFKRNFCKKDNCRKMLKIYKLCMNVKNIFLLCTYMYMPRNLIDKRNVPNPHEVDLFRIEGICGKLNWKLLYNCRKQHPLQFPTHTKQYPPETPCLIFVFLLYIQLSGGMSVGQGGNLITLNIQLYLTPLND